MHNFEALQVRGSGATSGFSGHRVGPHSSGHTHTLRQDPTHIETHAEDEEHWHHVQPAKPEGVLKESILTHILHRQAYQVNVGISYSLASHNQCKLLLFSVVAW